MYRMMDAVSECHLEFAVSRKLVKDSCQLLARLTGSREDGRCCYCGVEEAQREMKYA